MNTSRRRLWTVIAACAALMGLVHTAAAGLPMTCHPLQTGAAPLLPWGGSDWRALDRSYDVRHLTRDTLNLLSKDAPLLARMENLRRAALYGLAKPAAGDELLRAVLERAAAAGPGDRLAWFDAAYLVETFRQAGQMEDRNPLVHVMRPPSAWPDLNALDGYRMLGRLLDQDAPAGEELALLEFARGLMMRDGMDRHLRRAAQLAPAGSLLARNVATFL